MKKSSELEVKIGFSVQDLAAALQELSDKDRESFIKNLLVITSPEHLERIGRERRDYKEEKFAPQEESYQKTGSIWSQRLRQGI